MSKAVHALELRRERRILSWVVEQGMLNGALKMGYREAGSYARAGGEAGGGRSGGRGRMIVCVVVNFNSSPQP